MKASQSSTTRPSGALKIVFISIAIILACLIGISIGGALDERNNKEQKVQSQTRIDNTEAAVQKQKDDYVQCLSKAVQAGIDSISAVPSYFTQTERTQQIQAIQAEVDSQKADCDRFYGKN